MTAEPQVVVDTSVVSIIYNHDDRTPYYERPLAGRRSLISFQTLEELWFGTHKNDWGSGVKPALLNTSISTKLCGQVMNWSTSARACEANGDPSVDS